MDYFTYLILIIIITIVPQLWVNASYTKYSQIRVNSGINGEEVVRDMLRKNNVSGISINRIGGVLTDHYNSKTNSINLSLANFNEPTIASIAVAAHETGHALQDDKGYFFLRMRHAIGGAAIVASNLSWIVIYVGFLLFFTPLIWAGIALLLVVILFNLITLPVEINASRRAKEYLLASGNFTSEEINGASKVLTAAAFTYVAAALAGILQLIRLLNIVRRD